jgi:FHA domain-containing protein
MEAFGLGRLGSRSGGVFGTILDAPTSLPSGADGAEPEIPILTSAVEPMQVDLLVGDPTGAGVRRAPEAAMAPPDDRPGPSAAPAAPIEDLVKALYAGLGVPAPGPAAHSAAQLKLIGSLLRAAIEGTLALLATRTIAKRELGANATLLQTRENNPLKFSPDADAALDHLLGPSQRGFIAPLAAVSDAFEDLRAHEVAVLAGMRAALDEVLARFDPRALEQRFAPKAMWENLLPINRKAGLWEHYGEHYAEIMREIEGDFDSLFGRAFLQAYQAQLARLAQPTGSGPVQ